MICGTTARGQFVIATPTKTGMTTLKELARRHAGGRHAPAVPNFRQANWEEPSRDHRMSLPLDGLNGWATADRWLLVRNPFARWVSVYEYLRLGRNYSQWNARLVQGNTWPRSFGPESNPRWNKLPMNYGEFLNMIVEEREKLLAPRVLKRRGFFTEARAYRSPWIWTDTLWESFNYLADQPTVVGEVRGRAFTVGTIHIERLWDDLAMLAARYGIGEAGGGPPLSLRRSIHANRTTFHHLNGFPEEADRRDLEYWRAYYGPRFDLCTPYGEYKCSRWSGSPEFACAVCKLAMHAEALALGYNGKDLHG